ncbi:MAG: general secretion pathway protein GspL [Burkholderiales bacterium]|nr:general secretion pathway protein GspL [Burkholderiales bacterium]
MSTLALFLPERPRLGGAQGVRAAGYDWCLLDPQGRLLEEGHGAADQLPRSDQLALLMPPGSLSWQRVTLPRTSAKRWRAALQGLLEERLLEDAEDLHFAIEAQAAAGQDVWVAVCARAPLTAALAELDAAQRLVDRVVPLAWPQAQTEGHFSFDAAGGPLHLLLSGPDGVAPLPLQGGYARPRLTALQSGGTATLHWTASPEAQSAAEAWTGGNVPLRTPAQAAALALAGPWNLRQFDLAPRLSGLRWLRQAAQQLLHPKWKAARLGLLVWAGLGLVGLNVSAWQQRQAIESRQQQLEATLRTSFPRVGVVVQPQLQMQRELQTLRTQAGALGPDDLESLLDVLAVAWPAERGPTEALQYEPGQLSVPRAGFGDAQIDALRQKLASEGWQLHDDQGRLILRRRQP